jgi:hypothetical protein
MESPIKKCRGICQIEDASQKGFCSLATAKGPKKGLQTRLNGAHSFRVICNFSAGKHPSGPP